MNMSLNELKIRRRPFDSPEARTLIAELDDDIASYYPEYNPQENLHPGSLLPAETGVDTQPQQATSVWPACGTDPGAGDSRHGLFFFVAFANTAGGDLPVACAALRLLTPIPSVPLYIPPAIPKELSEGFTYAELKRFYLVPSHRGQGIAKALLDRVESFAQNELHVDFVVLEVGYRQQAAVKLYQRAGYIQRSMFGDHVGMEPEAGGDCLCMEKRLS